MSMSKKDFIALADVIRFNFPVAPDAMNREDSYNIAFEKGREHQYNMVRNILARFCASQNPRFNRGRWLAYIAGECGPNGGAVKKGKVV